MNKPSKPVLAECLSARTVAVVGHGSQGSAWAANLTDTGVRVVVALRGGDASASAGAARGAGHRVVSLEEAAAEADVFCMLTPDETHPGLIAGALAGMRAGSAVVFAHGYNVHFERVQIAAGVDVVLVAPKGVGPAVRRTYVEGSGVAGLIGVARDASGGAWALAEALAEALGCGRAGVYRSSFREETEADLFSEQALLCGGVPSLVRAGFDLLVSRGIAPEVAYFECLHELKLITDLMAERGVAGMFDRISTTAKFGAAWGGDRVVDAGLKARLGAIHDDIASGAFARALDAETGAGMPRVAAARAGWEASQIEQVGRAVRRRMQGMDS